MIQHEQSVQIARPVDDVFAFVTDIGKLPMWSGEIVEARKTSEGPTGVGTTWTGLIKALGRKMENKHVFTAFEENQMFTMSIASGPVSGEATYTFESVENGTQLTITVQAELGGFIKMAEPLARRSLDRQYEANLGNLKDLLEAEVEAAA
jgi:carbon monoxide dehydrogenase subunit G